MTALEFEQFVEGFAWGMKMASAKGYCSDPKDALISDYEEAYIAGWMMADQLLIAQGHPIFQEMSDSEQNEAIRRWME
ncbi:hypothetical protein M199_gp204 [Halogranum tailed virus 1]|uniref:Uncharacterized protein n=1 Tax=Halogranum tailed virus 1 TaxID=1273749 RepID=R4TLA5_9CAUD|nr:hypothetical protein M199_gp204 [Halogranum tailed virus 1]AGM11462.1 hypothetical protein HGTV1_165 [Halogranum tailed virus 1]